MAKIEILYKEESLIFAKYNHRQSDDFLEYKSTIQIKDTGKQPVIMKLNFDGIHPSFAPMPPEEHTIKAANIIELFSKLGRWFHKYGYEIK